MTLDRVSNMLSALKNASMAGRSELEVVHSKECEAIAKVLKEKGFLENVKVFKPTKSVFKMMALSIAKAGLESAFTDVKRVSKPGRRIYKPYKELHRVAAGLGVMIVSTSRGIMSSEQAKKHKLGGEVICEVI